MTDYFKKSNPRLCVLAYIQAVLLITGQELVSSGSGDGEVEHLAVTGWTVPGL